MSTRIRLDALIRRISRMAEQMFDKQGDIDPMWLVENALGEQHMIVSPIIADSPLASADKKDRIAARMRKYFAEHDIVRYARATECWTLGEPALGSTEEQHALRYAAMGYTFANHPDRREVVQIQAEDDTELVYAFRDIIRPAHGKPYLAKLGPIERYDSVTSRWTGLLPSKEHDAALRERPAPEPPRYVRFSKELPDDVGRVFVTAVPNAPIQLTGRRDPANGELCVGAVVGGPKDAPWPPPDHPPWIEVVTGPEAERLILAVHRWLTEQAEQEKITIEQLLEKFSQSSPIKRIFDCVCPTCGKAEGPFYLGQSIWFYCREHKVKWLAGYDLSAPETPDEDCKRRFEEIGMGEFKYLGPEDEEMQAALDKYRKTTLGTKP